MTETNDGPGIAVRVYHQVRLDRHDNGIEPRRTFEMAARWDPDLPTRIITRNGRDARSVIANLAEGEDVSTATLGVALLWLEHGQRYYETTEPPTEGHRGPWAEAARDLAEAARWLGEIRLACDDLPATLTIEEPA